DGAGRVGADEVALDDVAARRHAINVDAVVTVARDHVAGSDDVPGGAGIQDDAAVGVGEGDGAGRVGADGVPLDGVARDADARGGAPLVGVAGEDVAGPDHVVRATRQQVDAVVAVGQGGRVIGLDADGVALDHVAGTEAAAGAERAPARRGQPLDAV